MSSLRNTSTKSCFGFNWSGKGKLEGLFLALLALWVLASPAYAKYGGGSGTAEDPYQISTAADMNAIGTDSNDWDKHFKLTADIDLGMYTGNQFNIIGYFAGVFDGNNHTISNFTYDSNGNGNIGIFGYISGDNAEIKNLGLRDPNVWAQSEEPFTCNNIGSLVGRAISGTISNCYVEGGSVTGRIDVGGLVGDSESGMSITNCHATCSVTTTNNTGGGLIGENDGYVIDCYATGNLDGRSPQGGLVGSNSGTISNCYAAAIISPNESSNNVGGLVGGNYGTISDCYATGSILNGQRSIGGLVGLNSGSGTISKCYAAGSVAPIGPGGFNMSIGGLVGQNKGAVADSYAASNVSGKDGVGGLVGDNDTGATVTNSYSTGSVSGESVGGLVGWNDTSATITNSYSTSSVSGTGDSYSAGGLVGQIETGATVTNSYSTGSVSGLYYVGGLIGYNSGATVTASFWDTQTSGKSNGVGFGSSIGVTGKTTADMQTQTTFTDAGWDFLGETTNGTEDIWRLCPDGIDYARFVWQKAMSGDFVCADGIYMLDLAHLAAHWLEDDCNDLNGYCEGTDLNRSGNVNFPDYGLFAQKWRTGLTPFVLDEDFETGDFSKYNWLDAGDANWIVVGDVVYEGSYSAKSGLISHNEESVLKITLPIEDGSVGFYRKVSSESDEDYLRFYIDDDLQDSWSGEQDWSLQQYAITSGIHTLKWVYEKDVSISSGSDCAWIDKITVTGVMP